jgi:hypothetical protein
MSKKQDFLRSEQNRDKHPERVGEGTAARKTLTRGQAKGNPADFQQPGAGKVANDHNKVGNTEPTQTNQGNRTPESRNDRDSMTGGPQNQVSARKGGGGAGRNTRGAG